MTPKREARFRKVISQRQPNLTVILENVHDQHNIGAVLRSCEAVGISDVYILYTRKDLQRIGVGRLTSSGTRKWVNVHFYKNPEVFFPMIREKYQRIFATHLGESSKVLHDLDLTQPTALLFGNEHDGVSPESLAECNGNFVIPMFGFVQSLNISVACAISVFEAARQRNNKNMYAKNPLMTQEMQEEMYDIYINRNDNGHNQRYVFPEG